MFFIRTIVTPVVLTWLLFFALFFSGCTDKIKTDIIVFRALDESLIQSNKAIDNAKQYSMVSLQDKLTDPRTVEKAKLWYPKAQHIQAQSKEVYDYIEKLKQELKNEAGLRLENGIESFKENDKNAVMRLFERKGKGTELFGHLETYKKNILATDPEIDEVFKNIIFVTTLAFDSANLGHEDFTKTFFDDIPAIAAVAMLSKFQNNIKAIENKTIAFCNNKVPNNISTDFGVFNLFAAINKSYVKAEDKLEIVAAIGSFTAFAKPEIVVNGKTIPLEADGAAHYRFSARSEPGKHHVLVKINYTDQDGKQQIASKEIEYTVIE